MVRYADFSRSFTRVRASDILDRLEQIYADGSFWPDPLVSINPAYKLGETIEQLACGGTVCDDTARVFRKDGTSIQLYRHPSAFLFFSGAS